MKYDTNMFSRCLSICFYVFKMEYFGDEEENERFSNLVLAEEIEQRKKDCVPKNTQKQNRWQVNIWRNWVEWRNTKIHDISCICRVVFICHVRIKRMSC